MINEEDAAVVRLMYHMIVDEGYGTHRITQWLNAHGYRTRKGRKWRATAIRAIIANPLNIGVLHFGDTFSPPVERLRIIDDFYFIEANKKVKERAPKRSKNRETPLRSDSTGLLTGIIYCESCGNRMTYGHQVVKRTNSTGYHEYHRDYYRCNGKLHHAEICNGQTTYRLDLIEDPVLAAIFEFFRNIKNIPHQTAIDHVTEQAKKARKMALKKAVNELKKAQQEVEALQDAIVTALTKGGIDIAFFNDTIAQRKVRLAEAQAEHDRLMEETQKQEDQETIEGERFQRILSWAECFEKANHETKKMIIANLIERVEVGHDGRPAKNYENPNYRITIKFNLTAKQFLGQEDAGDQLDA